MDEDRIFLTSEEGSRKSEQGSKGAESSEKEDNESDYEIDKENVDPLFNRIPKEKRSKNELELNACGRRKRKSERDLAFLRKELKKEFLWSREKIIEISDRLNLAETQVYKWWWDQTRKRQKKLLSDTSKVTGALGAPIGLPNQQMLFPTTDEFGGYSSRLRLLTCCSSSATGAPTVSKNSSSTNVSS
jgi:hypothetical protein